MLRSGILATPLVDGPVLPLLCIASVALLVGILVRRRTRREFVILGTCFAGGLALGFLIGWLIGDVWNSFDLSPSLATRIWFSATIATVAVAVAAFRGSGRLRKLVAGVGVFLFLLTGALGINADVGWFATIGAAVGREYSGLALPPRLRVSSAPVPSAGSWHPPAGMPTRGRIGSAVIRGTVSGFQPRPALVYLPPAAYVAHPPPLPVLVMLSGQPGGPVNLFSSGQLGTVLDDYSRAHNGLAPIVVVPDHLGQSDQNPMCLDSPLGNAATYLTVDVPAWISQNLNVAPDRTEWAIGGFSEGGTCAIQLGAAYPRLFGSILDISGEIAPKRGSVQATIRDAFGGSTAAYDRAKPSSILKANAPYSDTLAIFTVGSQDARYSPAATQLASDARSAGMTVISFDSPSAHDWHSVDYSVRRALPDLARRWGLG